MVVGMVSPILVKKKGYLVLHEPPLSNAKATQILNNLLSNHFALIMHMMLSLWNTYCENDNNTWMNCWLKKAD